MSFPNYTIKDIDVNKGFFITVYNEEAHAAIPVAKPLKISNADKIESFVSFLNHDAVLKMDIESDLQSLYDIHKKPALTSFIKPQGKFNETIESFEDLARTQNDTASAMLVNEIKEYLKSSPKEYNLICIDGYLKQEK